MNAQRFLPNPAAAPVGTAAAMTKAAADGSSGTYRTYAFNPTLRTSQNRWTGQTSQTATIFRKRPALVAALAAARAQELTAGPWKITSSTADGGGGRSTAGAWTVTGTIGQPDATTATYSAGAFAIAGGFWADAAVIPTDNNGPQLTISRLDATSVQLAWPAEASGWTLQKSTDLTNWSDVQSIPPTSAPGSGSWPLSTGPRHFFRLILK